MLQKASEINNLGKKSPLEQKRELQEQSKINSDRIITSALNNGILECSQKFSVSTVTVVKTLIKAFKRDNIEFNDLIIDNNRKQEIEEFLYSVNSSSIKKLLVLSNGKYNEEEIRIVKAIIEKERA